MKLKYIMALADSVRLAAQSGHSFSAEQIDILAEFSSAFSAVLTSRNGWLTFKQCRKSKPCAEPFLATQH
jgi:hypothetical protein